ncbi:MULTISPECIES: HPP family protein [unclassified Nocardiopsis]|uniref:HPP family protein n=1 Tax=unclassified Nocardiopsis TaxID=2649073 RepID=UPI0013575D5F|nr:MULTISPECIES: HPP family protein [unclassified Nocardiopsis]
MATDTSDPRPQSPRALSFLAGRAPAPAGWRAVGAGTLTSVAALLVLAAATAALDVPLLIPPLAASMALVAGAPALPLAQPRSVVGGQLLSALTGFGVLAVAGPGLWAAAVAGGLALGVMALARTPHSPAAATAVIVALEAPPFWTFLGLLLAATAVLVAVGLAGARASGRAYPAYWW